MCIRDSVKDELSQGGTHRNFDEAGVLDASGKGKSLGAWAVFRTYGFEPGSSAVYYPRNIGISLNIIKNSRLVKETVLDRTRRFYSRHSAVSFDGSRKEMCIRDRHGTAFSTPGKKVS